MSTFLFLILKGSGRLVLENKIDMVVVGPEVPLVEGIHDFFLSDPLLKDIHVIGPRQQAAMLEGSKDFAKAFLLRHKIPTARYKTFDRDQVREALHFLDDMNPPYVIKADGLAAGKGVVICKTLKEAQDEIKAMLLYEKFGEASAKVIIEEFLSGIEMSAFVLTDGIHYLDSSFGKRLQEDRGRRSRPEYGWYGISIARAICR